MAREIQADALSIGGQRITGVKQNLSDNSHGYLATQAAVKAAIDAVSLSAGNILNAISIESYGAVEGSTSSGDKTANVDALTDAIAAAADNQLIIVPDGTYYFNDDITFSSTSKKFNFLQIGRCVFDAGYGYIVEGNFHTINLQGILEGTNSGATNETGYSAYTGTGLYLRNADKCRAWVNRILNFHTGIKVGGESTTTPKGAQYNTVFYTQIRNCFIQIHVTTTGTTDGTQGGDVGNWSNSNWFFGGQIGGGTTEAGGTYGILIQKDASSNQASTNPFNYNHFFHTGFEGLKYGIEAVNADFNAWIGGRWETNAVTYKINLQEDNSSGLGCFNNKIDMVGLYESYFVSGGKGITTQLPNKMLTDNGVPSADMVIPVAGTTYMAIVGDEPTSRTSTFDMFAIGGMGSNKDEWNAGHVIREATSTDDYIPLRGKTVTSTSSTPSFANSTRLLLVNYASGTATVTMPTASSFPEREITVKNIHGSNNVSANSETLTPGQAITWRSNGTSWYAVAKF